MARKNCAWAGDDLPLDQASAVKGHLSLCDGCRAFERDVSQTRAMLLTMRTVDDSDVATVRSNVMRELQARKNRSVFSWMPYAAAIAGLVFGWTMWRSPAIEQRPLADASGLVQAPAPALTEAPKRGRVARRKARIKPQPKSEPSVVTLFTDDPDVVIVWITD